MRGHQQRKFSLNNCEGNEWATTLGCQREIYHCSTELQFLSLNVVEDRFMMKKNANVSVFINI